MSEIFKKLCSRTLSLITLLSFFSCSYLPYIGKRTSDNGPQKKLEALEKKYQELISKSTPATSVVSKSALSSDYQEKLKVKQNRTLDGSKYDRSKIARELRSLKKLQSKLVTKKYGDAVILAKELENSRVEQIRAQARFLLAKVMEAQGELIIAMQIYEEVALSMPFSIFSKRAIQEGLNITDSIDDQEAKQRFLLLKRPFERGSRS